MQKFKNVNSVFTYEASLPLRIIDICFLQECISYGVMIGDKQCKFLALCRSPSQNQDEVDPFSKDLEITLDKLLLNNRFVLVVIGDLNTKSKKWYPLDRTTYEGHTIKTITSHFGLHQLIHGPTHILGRSSSCIDLIFTALPNIVLNSGVHSSLHANCHHQILFAKFDLKIHYLSILSKTSLIVPTKLNCQILNVSLKTASTSVAEISRCK